MAQIWLHSDWHRHHQNIYKFTSYPGGPRIRERFASCEEGDAYIEQRIRDLVKPEHHLYFLGDLTMAEGNHYGSEFAAFFKSLPGHKRLIGGNHDKLKMKWYIEAGFQKILWSNIVAGVLCTHYPVHPSSIGRALGNAHGHIHEKPSPTGPYYNCCVEVNNYEPVPIEVVQAVLRKQRAAIAESDISGVPILGE